MNVDFLDSNVLVYLFDRQDERRRGIAEKLLRQAHEDGNGAISWQVVQETLHVVTRKVQPALSADEARAVRLLADVGLLPRLRHRRRTG